MRTRAMLFNIKQKKKKGEYHLNEQNKEKCIKLSQKNNY